MKCSKLHFTEYHEIKTFDVHNVAIMTIPLLFVISYFFVMPLNQSENFRFYSAFCLCEYRKKKEKIDEGLVVMINIVQYSCLKALYLSIIFNLWNSK